MTPGAAAARMRKAEPGVCWPPMRSTKCEVLH
jgi:hypothetical protein